MLLFRTAQNALVGHMFETPVLEFVGLTAIWLPMP